MSASADGLAVLQDSRSEASPVQRCPDSNFHRRFFIEMIFFAILREAHEVTRHKVLREKNQLSTNHVTFYSSYYSYNFSTLISKYQK